MRIGIDLGGTKIEAIALDSSGEESLRRRIATPAGDYGAVVAAVAELVHGVEGELGVKDCTVGVGTPGAISPRTGFIKNSNTTCLIGKPLTVDLTRRLGREVRLANDANCFTLSEATDGAAANATVVFGVILGTGTGGGLVVRGQVLNGANAITGEWGHNPLPWPADDERPGPKCYCGKFGCIETFLSGPGLARDYERVCGKPLAADHIATLASMGSVEAGAALDRYEDRLARALAHVVNIVDPDVIVLGGGVSNIKRLYANVPRLWGKYIFSDHIVTQLVPAKFGDSSGVRGAAWLWA